MTAAFAILLRELPRKSARIARLRWKVRPRRLRKDWTVTAGLAGDRLTRVDHYDTKLEAVAAAPRPLNVIVAAKGPAHVGDDPVEHLARRLGLVQRVHMADDVTAAVALTRSVNQAFVVGLVVLMVFLASLTGVGVIARNAVGRAEHAADVRTAAATLVQRANELKSSNPRLAALAALASNRLAPNADSRTAMSNVLAANQLVVSSRQVSKGYVADLAVNDDTMLALDGSGRVTAWQLPTLAPLGELPVHDVDSVAAGGTASFTLRTGRDLHQFQDADGFIPREVSQVHSTLSGRTYGPFNSAYLGAWMMIDSDLHGVVWGGDLEKPYDFDLTDRTELSHEPGHKSVNIVAAMAADSTDFDELPEKVTELSAVDIATSAGQILKLRIWRSDAGEFQVVLDTVMPADDAKPSINSLAEGPRGILVGTDRGILEWDPVSWQTVEFPYAGWSAKVQSLSGNAVLSDHDVGIIDTPQDNRPRGETATVHLDGSSFDALAQLPFDANKYLVAREDGTVLLLNADNSRFGPPPYPGSNLVQFTSDGYLLRTDQDTQHTGSISTQAVPPKAADEEDPGERSYELPATNGAYPYINGADGSADWIVASGRQADGRGKVWVWRRAGTDVERVLDFGQGEKGAEPIPDIVSDVFLLPTQRELVAHNPGMGQVRFWSTSDWSPITTVQLAKPKDYDEASIRMLTAARDGTTIAVKDSAHSVTIIDAVAHVTKSRLTGTAATIVKIGLSPDGRLLAVTSDDNSLTLYDVTGAKPAKVATRTFDGLVSVANFSADGATLAIAVPEQSAVRTLDAKTLEDVTPAWPTPKGSLLVTLGSSPKSDFLAVGTMEHSGTNPVQGPVYVINTSTLSWSKQLCGLSGGPLTASDWDQLVDTNLARPAVCTGHAQAEPTTKPVASAKDEGLTLEGLMAGARAPAMCNHAAGTMINGVLPYDGLPGGVGLAQTAFGDLNDDGVDDAAAVINCTAGGVAWPPAFVAYLSDPDGKPALVGSIGSASSELLGSLSSERPVAQAIDIRDGQVVVDYIATTDHDPACCGSLPVQARLAVEAGHLAVVSSTLQHDVSAVNQELNDQSMLFDGDEPLAPAEVTAAIEDLRDSTTGSLSTGTCYAADEVPADLGSFPRLPNRRYCTVLVQGQKKPALTLELEKTRSGLYKIVRVVAPED